MAYSSFLSYNRYDKFLPGLPTWGGSMFDEADEADEAVKIEEEQTLNNLGEVLIIKDELCEVFDGEVVVLCPGYGIEDVTVNEGSGGKVYVLFNPIDGEKIGSEYEFDADDDYEYVLSYSVKNGVLKIKASYIIETNVTYDESL